MRDDCGTSSATVGGNRFVATSTTWRDGNPCLTAEELDDLQEQEAEAMQQHWQRRERKLWKARAAMPMHGKHLLRDHRKQTRGLR